MPARSLTFLQQNILRTIAYFDVFAYPLTPDQVFTYLPSNSVTQQQVTDAMDALVGTILQRRDRYYFFMDRNTNIVEARVLNERRAQSMLRKARWISRFIKQLPFVRAVFITGSLSKNVAESSSDIDYMIVTAADRLWICKMMLTGIRKIFLFNKIKYFCTNLLVTEKNYGFHTRNMFNAIEIVTTKAVWNRNALSKFMQANSWISSYLPNWRPGCYDIIPVAESRSLFQQMMEEILSIFPLDRLNGALMSLTRRYWKRRNAHLDERKFNELFQCRQDIASAWYNDHGGAIMNKYHRRLQECGLRPSV